MKEKAFRFCSECGGIISLDNSCAVCNEIRSYQPVNALEHLLPPPVGAKKSEMSLIEGITEEVPKLAIPRDRSRVQELNGPRFLRIEDGDPLILFPCPECDSKLREVAVLTCKIAEKSYLYGDCNHSFKATLPSPMVEDILGAIRKKE